jgi:ribonuclease HI
VYVNAEDLNVPETNLFGPVVLDAKSPFFLGATKHSNNTGELSAWGEALLYLQDHGPTLQPHDVTVFYDSDYAFKAVTGSHKRAEANVELVQRIQLLFDELNAQYAIRCVHIRAHQEQLHALAAAAPHQQGNTLVDELAKRGAAGERCTAGRYAARPHRPSAPRATAVVPDVAFGSDSDDDDFVDGKPALLQARPAASAVSAAPARASAAAAAAPAAPTTSAAACPAPESRVATDGAASMRPARGIVVPPLAAPLFTMAHRADVPTRWDMRCHDVACNCMKAVYTGTKVTSQLAAHINEAATVASLTAARSGVSSLAEVYLGMGLRVCDLASCRDTPTGGVWFGSDYLLQQHQAKAHEVKNKSGSKKYPAIPFSPPPPRPASADAPAVGPAPGRPFLHHVYLQTWWNPRLHLTGRAAVVVDTSCGSAHHLVTARSNSSADAPPPRADAPPPAVHSAAAACLALQHAMSTETMTGLLVMHSARPAAPAGEEEKDEVAPVDPVFAELARLEAALPARLSLSWSEPDPTSPHTRMAITHAAHASRFNDGSADGPVRAPPPFEYKRLQKGTKITDEIPADAMVSTVNYMRPSFVQVLHAIKASNWPAVTRHVLHMHTELADILTVSSSHYKSANVHVAKQINEAIQREEAHEFGRGDEYEQERAERAAADAAHAAAYDEPADRGGYYSGDDAPDPGPDARLAHAARPLPIPVYAPAVVHGDPVAVLTEDDAPLSAEQRTAQEKRDVRVLRKIQKLLQQGLGARAVRLALRADALRPADATDPMLDTVRAQHPRGDMSSLPPKPEAPPLIFTPTQVLTSLKAADNGSAPGPSGISCRVLRQLAQADPVILECLTALFSAMANGQWRDMQGHAFATGGLSVLINKRASVDLRTAPSDGDDDDARNAAQLHQLFGLNRHADATPQLRTLTCGEAILKVTGLMVLARMPPSGLAALLAPFQLGVGTKGGVEVAIMRLQRYLEEQGADADSIVLFLDIADAFMRADRAKMLQAIFSMPELRPTWHLAHWHLSAPNPRYLPLADGSVYVFEQTQGGPQGDPLMPLWFCSLIYVLHKRILARATTAACILDDTAAAGHVSVVSRIYADAVRLAPELCGFEIKPQKTLVLSVSRDPSPAVLAFVQTNQLQFAHGHAGYVGGIVGTDIPAMQTWVKDKARSHAPLFRLLVHPLMPKKYATDLLRLTLLPSFNLLLRAHDPRVTVEGARLLDQAVQHAYAAINDAPEFLDPAHAQRYSEAQLPVRMAGDGLCPAEPQAYISSYAAHAAAAHDVLLKETLARPPSLLSFRRAPAPVADPVPPDLSRALAATIASADLAVRLVHESLVASASAAGHDPGPPREPPDGERPMSTQEAVYTQLSQLAAAVSPSMKDDKKLPATYQDFCSLFQSRPLEARHLQHHLTRLLYKDKYEALLSALDNDADRARLRSLKHRNPYPNLDTRDPTLFVPNAAHCLTMRHRRGLQPAHVISISPAASCACGALLALDKQHFTSCKQFSAQCQQSHNDAYGVIMANMAACGVRCDKEQLLGHGQLRSDIWCQLPQNAKAMHLDFTVTNPAAASICKTAARDTPYGAILAREKQKNTKYEAIVRARGATFSPWVVDPFGTASTAAHGITKQLHEAAGLLRHPSPPSVKTMMDRVSHAVFLGTALIHGAGLARMEANNSHVLM